MQQCNGFARSSAPVVTLCLAGQPHSILPTIDAAAP
jgi:hypothetical protein